MSVYSIQDLAQATGYTEYQVRERLELLSPILSEHMHRGKRGKVLVGDAILAALRRMAELEREGLSPKVARDYIIDELGNGRKKTTEAFAHGPYGSDAHTLAAEAEARVLRELVDELRKERDYWRDLALNLQAKIPALPSPRESKPWWARGIFKWLWL